MSVASISVTAFRYDRYRDRGEAGARPDVNVGLPQVRDDRKAVADMVRDLLGRGSSRHVEVAICFEHEPAVARQRVDGIGFEPLPARSSSRAANGQAVGTGRLSRWPLWTKRPTMATSDGVIPGIRPAIPSVRGRRDVNFSRASAESAAIER